jgi:hypothetical protein
MADLDITRAKLIPMNGDNPESDESQHIDVQFNPATLRVTLSNTLKADNNGNSENTSAAQYVDKSESSLTVELVFDTSVKREGVAANSDVREQTKRIAETFMKPQNPDSDRPGAPKRCRLQWGRFQFTGLVSSYTETLDFFAPEGIPLRATLALTLKEDRYQFETNQSAAAAGTRHNPSFTPSGPGMNASDISLKAGLGAANWRVIADMNDLENPRVTPSGSVMVPGANIRFRS